MSCPANGSHLMTSAVTASSRSCERGAGCQPIGSWMKKVSGPSGCGSRALMATQPWTWRSARAQSVSKPRRPPARPREADAEHHEAEEAQVGGHPAVMIHEERAACSR
jgi:hypothetical protein